MVFIDACHKKPVKHTPIWMMRQAGRYLPEYRATRAKAKNFIEFFKSPELACEATLQPIDLLGVDAAILFSDILPVPLEMGLDLEFIPGTGPVIHNPVRSEADLGRLGDDAPDRLTYVYDAVKIIRRALPADKALIGFAGSPWTLATYMVEGSGSKNYAIIKKLLYTQPQVMHALLEKNTQAVTEYLLRQIEAGADAVQIFDSWGGALEQSMFFEFSWSYMLRIAQAIRAKYPDTPIILFSKGVGSYLEQIEGDFDVFGVDWCTPIARAKEILHPRYTLQGNMEPMRLYDRDRTREGVEEIFSVMGKADGFIFNLGHGMVPDLSPDNAKYVVELVHEISAR